MNTSTYTVIPFILLVVTFLFFPPKLILADNATGTTPVATTTPTDVTHAPEIMPEATTTPSVESNETESSRATSTPGATTTPDSVIPAQTASSSPNTVTIIIRYKDTTAFSGVVPLSASSTETVDVLPTDTLESVSIPADSLLATLVALDASTTEFALTKLTYYSSFDSFIIDCIAIPTTSTSSNCFDWTYAVNGVFPNTGTDDYLLKHNDTVHLFFGPQRKAVLESPTAFVGEPFVASVLKYDLELGSYVPASGFTLGVGLANPDFTFTELATSTSDTSGEAVFTLNATGTYAVGIAEDYYYPSVPITIVPPATSSSSPDNSASSTTPTGGSKGSGSKGDQFDIPQALAFISSVQAADGSFGVSMYTDWTALAFAAANPGSAKAKLRAYLQQETPLLYSVTDYIRHAMALMSLGINPYTGSPIDSITPILNAFDGTQIGDASFDNDDIFALFPLLHAGYDESDLLIQKVTEFILTKQKSNGSWDDSPDMTAAAIQALRPVYMISGVNSALEQASGYLVSTQQPDGGWGNIDSTSWVQTAINAINDSEPSGDWENDEGVSPLDALTDAQHTDGGVRSTSESEHIRLWSTSYAVTAASGKHWVGLLQSFARPQSDAQENNRDGNGTPDFPLATTTSSTTDPLAADHMSTTPQVLGLTTIASSSSETPTLASAQPTSPRLPVRSVDTTKFRWVSDITTSEKSAYMEDPETADPTITSTSTALSTLTPISDSSSSGLPYSWTRIIFFVLSFFSLLLIVRYFFIRFR